MKTAVRIQTQKYVENSTMQDRKALIVYGSETGNAQDAAEELGRICERLRFSTRVVELNAIGLVSLGVQHQRPLSYAIDG